MQTEHFIPFRKSDIIAMCVDDGQVPAADSARFKQFCAILQSIVHFEFHDRLERLKDLYAPFDPTSDTRPLRALTAAESAQRQTALVAELEGVLAKGNFQRVSEDELNHALSEESVFRVQLHTDLDDFAELIIHRRGVRTRDELISTWFGLRKRPLRVDYFERVAIYVRFKDAAYFDAKDLGKKKPRRNFVAGSTVLKLFQNIPKADIEMLFPNVDVRMKLADHAMIGVPAVLGAIGILAKVGASLLVVWLMIQAWMGMRDQPPEGNTAHLVALGLGLFTLAMYLIRQIGKFKNRKMQFMKALADNLYFKNLDNNAGVFHHLIDSAEEEECKEAILAYAFLRRSGATGMTEPALDAAIEAWFHERWKVELDFEVDDALAKLERFGLAARDGELWRPVEIDQALERLDERWDNFFVYANGAAPATGAHQG